MSRLSHAHPDDYEDRLDALTEAADAGGPVVPPVTRRHPCCPDCGHPLHQHHRHVSGAYRCTSFGCGCEQATVDTSVTSVTIPTAPHDRES